MGVDAGGTIGRGTIFKGGRTDSATLVYGLDSKASTTRYLSARHGTGQTIRTLEGHANLVRAVAVTPDSGRAVSASGLRGR
jgi:hypothetical protein